MLGPLGVAPQKLGSIFSSCLLRTGKHKDHFKMDYGLATGDRCCRGLGLAQRPRIVLPTRAQHLFRCSSSYTADDMFLKAPQAPRAAYVTVLL